jgi:hypothetical protein
MIGLFRIQVRNGFIFIFSCNDSSGFPAMCTMATVFVSSIKELTKSIFGNSQIIKRSEYVEGKISSGKPALCFASDVF